MPVLTPSDVSSIPDILTGLEPLTVKPYPFRLLLMAIFLGGPQE